MATGREQNGQLFGVHVKAFTTPPATLNVPQLRVAALPAGELPSSSKTPETPVQTNWRLAVKAMNNLIVSDFDKLNGRSAIPIRDCRGVESYAALNRRVVNIVYATGRKYTGPANGGPGATIKSLYGSDAAPVLHLGCVRVSVPLAAPGAVRRAEATQPAGSKAVAERKAEFVIPPSPPKVLDLASKARFYFPPDERTAFSSYDRALLFIHGFNNDFEYSIGRTARFAAESNYDGFIYAFSWPAQGGVGKYFGDMDIAEQSELELAHFMRMIMNAGSATRLDIVAHSMGSQILLRTLDALRPQFDRQVGAEQDANVRLGQVIFAAPDVGETVFRRKVVQLRQFADRISVYASANDGALGLSGWLRGSRRAGIVDDSGKPIQVDNIDVIDITGHAMPWYSPRRYLPANHSAFVDNDRVIEDISTILEQSASGGKRARWSPITRAAAAGRRGSIVPGDCEESKKGKITWWKLKVDGTLLSDCPALTATSSIR